MRIPITSVILSTLAVGTVAWADENKTQGQVSSDYTSEQSPGQVSSETTEQSTTGVYQAPGATDQGAMTTSAEASEVTKGYLNNEVVGFKPQVGVMAFTDQFGNSQGRAAYGFTLESNIANAVGLSNRLYLGPQTGFIFSHAGDPGSNFFGTSSNTNIGAGGSNMFLIPVDLKLGYNATDHLRISAHGGGNVLYRSVANAFYAGDSSTVGGPVWRIFPNVGGDLEYAFAPNLAVMARPDVTLTPGDTLFTGTLALNIALG